jgi:hypothetical protein
MTKISGNDMDLIPSSWTAVFPFIPEYPDVRSKQNDCEMTIVGCDSSGSEASLMMTFYKGGVQLTFGPRDFKGWNLLTNIF